ncbi:bifunctional nuclease domain-containing protein [Bacteroidota bacterium]
MRKIRLNVLGISYSQTQTGAYALVLNEEGGERRIPIIIGGFEAQSIAIQLEGLQPPRPLTHDLFKNFAKSFLINLKEINIYKLEEGVFYSNLICDREGEEIEIDARTSDAIALALRFNCPIYTTEEILSKSGIIVDINFEKEKESKGKSSEQQEEVELTSEFSEKKNIPSDISNLSNTELEELLGEAVKAENYERASEIRDELKKRRGPSGN